MDRASLAAQSYFFSPLHQVHDTGPCHRPGHRRRCENLGELTLALTSRHALRVRLHRSCHRRHRLDDVSSVRSSFPHPSRSAGELGCEHANDTISLQICITAVTPDQLLPVTYSFAVSSCSFSFPTTDFPKQKRPPTRPLALDESKMKAFQRRSSRQRHD